MTELMTGTCIKVIQVVVNRDETRQTMKWLLEPHDEYMDGHDQLYFYACLKCPNINFKEVLAQQSLT